MAFRPPLLWLDCTAGAFVGVGVLALSGWLSAVEGLPRGVLVFTGVVNVVYAAFSFSLAVRRRRPLVLVSALAVANLAWAPVCLGLAVAFGGRATAWGGAHLVGEAVFVGTLGAVEWAHRHRLASGT